MRRWLRGLPGFAPIAQVHPKWASGRLWQIVRRSTSGLCIRLALHFKAFQANIASKPDVYSYQNKSNQYPAPAPLPRPLRHCTCGTLCALERLPPALPVSTAPVQPPALPAALTAPIGVFDSGVGGLSVLRQLLRLLPHENMVYLADTAWAPYGARSPQDVQSRSLAIGHYLRARHGIKALVVACNTATAVAVQAMRAQWPAMPLVGIEPAIKPAVAQSQTRCVAVMATQGTVGSAKFQQLVALHGQHGTVRVQACEGLALAIENALEGRANPDGATVQSLCARFVQALGPFGATAGADTLVLGCTHYPFAAATLQALVGPHVRLLEPGEPVAQQTRRLLLQHGLLQTESAATPAGRLQLLSTAAPERLQRAASQWLPGQHPAAQLVTLPA